MEFEKMQKLWDQNSNQVVYAIDEQTLFSKVIKKQQSVSKLIACFEWTAIFTFIGLAVFAVVEGLLEAQYYQLPLGLVFVALAGYMFWDRLTRLRRETTDVSDIRMSLENSIAALSHQINRQKNILWWFFGPLIGVAIYQGAFSDKSWWAIGIAIIAMSGIYWLTQKEIRCKLQPQKNELQRLKELLEEQD